MRWQANQFQVQDVESIPLKIDKFSGLNTATTASKIDFFESPDLINIVLDAEGRPDKRFGFSRIYATSLGSGKINGMFEFKKKDGTTIFLIHWGTNLYTQTGSAQPVSIYSSMANARSVFYTFNNFCWIKDGTNYLRYDGTSVVTVASIAYVPTLFISTPPAGGGTANENFNLLGAGFKQSFSGNGTATTFQLALTSLDATAVSAVVNGITILEGAGLTVNRTTGLVTFTVAPTTGTNNVIITAFKTVSTNPDIVNKCTDFVIFGGTNDTRVHWYGNSNMPNRVQHSGLFDPSYAPDLAFLLVGSDSSAVKKMVAQYDTCIILKGPLLTSTSTTQNANENIIWAMSFDLSSGVASFPLKPLNNQINCISIDSVQLIQNNPTWLSSLGVQQLAGTNVKDERNTQHISFKIDRSADLNLSGLLDISTIANSVSADFDQKYILATQNATNDTFVFDYTLGSWLKWGNIKASCFLERGDGYLYFGNNTTGLVYKFLKSTDSLNFQDDGAAINCYIKTKLLDFDYPQYLKSVPKMWYHLKPASSTSADISYMTDNYTSVAGSFPSEFFNLFDYSLWDYANFTYLLSGFPQATQVKIKAKRFNYLQITVANPRIDESMGLLVLQLYAQIWKESK